MKKSPFFPTVGTLGFICYLCSIAVESLQYNNQHSFSSGTSSTYTVPSGVVYIEISMCGANGAGGSLGGSVATSYSVSSGQQYQITVGGDGSGSSAG